MPEGKNHSRRRFLGGLLATAGAGSLSGLAHAEGFGMGMRGPSQNRVVYQLNQSDPDYIKEILHSAAVVLQHYNNDVDIVIDCFGPGIWLLVRKEKNRHQYEPFIHEQVSSLSMYGVVFNACLQTIKTVRLERTDLVHVARPVVSGALDLIELQKKGYAYISW